MKYLLLVLLGIYFSLGLNHLFVWVGRRTAKLSLAYVYFSFTLCLITIFSRVLPEFGYEQMLFEDLKFFFIGLSSLAVVYFVDTASRKSIIKKKVYIIFFIINTLFLIFSIIMGNNLTLRLFPIFYVVGAFIVITSALKLEYEFGKLTFNLVTIVSFILITIVGTSGIIGLAVFKKDLPYIIYLIAYIFAIIINNYILTRGFNEEHKKLMAAEGSLQEQVELKTAELKESNQMLNNFINLIGHEIKDRLSGVLNLFVQYFQDGSEEGVIIASQMQEIATVSNVLVGMHDGGFDKVKFIDVEVINVSEFLEAKVKALRSEAERVGVSISVRIDGNIFVNTSLTGLITMVDNLIRNAIKYTGIKQDGERKISVSLSGDGDNLMFAVRDTGIGIKNKDEVFKMFTREVDRVEGIAGAGIGLTLVKRIVDSMNGIIKVESTVGQGTTFRVILTQYTPGAEDVPVEIPAMTGGIEVDIESLPNEPGRFNVLYVENEPAHVKVFVDSFKDEFNLYIARDGADALEKLKKIEKPNVIVSDVHMQPMGGFEFREAITADYKDVPFIFLTALDGEEIEERSIRSGAMAIMKKTGLDYELLRQQILVFAEMVKSAKESFGAVELDDSDLQRVAHELGLNKSQSIIMRMTYYNKENDEIAAILGVVENTVRSKRSQKIYKAFQDRGYNVNNPLSLRDALHHFIKTLK